MFKELMNLKYKRSVVQAIGFYIFHIIIIAIISFTVTFLYGALSNNISFEIGVKIGARIALIYCFSLALLMLIRKKLYTTFSAIILFLLTIVCAMFLGSILGCVCPAILSTFKAKSN